MTDEQPTAEPIAVHLNRHTCAGQRTCEQTAPSVFRFSVEKGFSEVTTEVVEHPDIIRLVREAEASCPTQSIHILS